MKLFPPPRRFDIAQMNILTYFLRVKCLKAANKRDRVRESQKNRAKTGLMLLVELLRGT
jgi:hypothetical protein